MHSERNMMMLKKEDYCNNMFDLEQLKLAVVKEPQLVLLESHTGKINTQQLITVESEVQYEQ